MIFVRCERSKHQEAREFFMKLYDGTPRKYPRGDMLFFIPITARLTDEYTDAQRAKYLFNHQSYTGDEDCEAIVGSKPLNTGVTLQDGTIVTIRTLLKSLPAEPGMTRPRLFQVVDPHPTKPCVLVTFQRSDRLYIEQRKETLEDDLISYLLIGEIDNLLEDPTDGLSFLNAHHKHKGKVIRVQAPSKEHQEFVAHANKLLNSPPKKRTASAVDRSTSQNQVHCSSSSATAAAMTYSGIVQSQTTSTTSTRSTAAKPRSTTTTTTTTTSQTIMAVVETRFQMIEQENINQRTQFESVQNKVIQQRERLHNVEAHTSNISDDIAAMMAFWKITPAGKREHLEIGNKESAVGQANHHASTDYSVLEDNCF